MIANDTKAIAIWALPINMFGNAIYDAFHMLIILKPDRFERRARIVSIDHKYEEEVGVSLSCFGTFVDMGGGLRSF